MKHITLLILISISFLTGCSHQATHPTKSGYLDFDQGKIYYETYGKGEPIIVLHGGPGSSHNYLLPQMLKLAEHNQVTFYDQRGCGKSTDTPYDKKYISHAQFVDDLDALRKALGYEKITLLGHSYGGLLSMKYAIKYPDHVKSMILVDPSPSTLAGNMAFMKEFSKRIVSVKRAVDPTKELSDKEKYDVALMAKQMKALSSMYFYNPEKAKELTMYCTQDFLKGYWKTFDILWPLYTTEQFDLRPALAKLTIPTLIIHGDHDIIPLSTVNETHSAIPKSELVVIKDSDHYTYIEKPKEFFDAIDEFLHYGMPKLGDSK